MIYIWLQIMLPHQEAAVQSSKSFHMGQKGKEIATPAIKPNICHFMFTGL